jgi:hypothetical protein
MFINPHNFIRIPKLELLSLNNIEVQADHEA